MNTLEIASANAGTRRPNISGTQWQQEQRPWGALKKLGNEAPGAPKKLQNDALEAPKQTLGTPNDLWRTNGRPRGFKELPKVA